MNGFRVLRQAVGNIALVSLRPAGDEPVWLWAVTYRDGVGWQTEIHPGWRGEVGVPAAGSIAVRAVNRLGLESAPAVLP